MIILLGTLLLSLPIAARNGQATSIMTALFTSTSATCVTGLTVVNSAVHWSFFGQVILAILMEVGGLGYMSFAVMFSLLISRKMSMSTRILTEEALDLESVSQINVVYRIIRMSLIIQVGGAILLFCHLGPRYGWRQGMWYSIFHSISAFCNAGFDLFGNSLNSFANDPYVILVMSAMIIAGSFGFLVWRDLLYYPERHHLSLHTQLALWTTGVILVGSVILLLITEKNFAQDKGSLDMWERLVNTFFLAVTPRTAGFTTISYLKVSQAGIAITIILMFIGGCPGSTAGGIKTTTLGILLLQIHAIRQGKRDVEFAHRRFSLGNVMRALTLLSLAIFIVITAILILLETQHLPQSSGLVQVTFEVVSAFSNCGSTLDFTPHLNSLGRLVVIFLMFIGRVGIYTVMYSLFNTKRQNQKYRLAKENVLIG